jgi:beta-lactamase regulating signal transducer with metallopeptidase domain
MIGVSAAALQVAGWTLLHFIWQGVAIAALFGASLMFCRQAQARYALGIATLALMMVAPVLTFAWLSSATGSISQLSAQAASATIAQQIAAPAEHIAFTVVAQATHPSVMLWVVQAWLLGVILLTARTAGGVLWISRIRRSQIELLTAEIHNRCLAIQQRMRLNRAIHYGHCRSLDSPMVLGWFRPIVLVTTQALTGLTVQQLQAVIAHELAHIRRHDAFINLLQIAAETLLFYHPAIWWVSRRIRIEREVCCDDEALAVCGEPVSYARALALMEEWRTAPALSMAANRGPLTERVLRLLGVTTASHRIRAAGIGISALCIAAALFAGQSFVEVAHATLDDPPTRSQGRKNDVEITTPPPLAAPAPTTAPAEPPAPTAVTPVRPRTAPRPPTPTEIATPRAELKSHSYIDDLAAVGFQNLSANELIAMKVQGVTPEQIQAVITLGLRPTINELIAMQVHGVTAHYVREAQSVLIDPAVDELISMKVHGVTPQSVRELQAAGMDVRYGRDAVAAKVQGITPDLIRSAIDQGFSDLRLQQLVFLKNTHVL